MQNVDAQGMQNVDTQGTQVNNAQVTTIDKEAQVSHKRSREEVNYIAETITGKKFKTSYIKRTKLTTEEKDKAMEIDDNNGQETDDEATVIVI